MKIQHLVTTLALALSVLGAPQMARAAASGHIYEIRPWDAVNNVVTDPPAVPFAGGETAYFAVRLQRPTMGGNPFRLVHVGTGSYYDDWYSRRPTIGIYVSGEFREAQYEYSWKRSDDFTDFIFSYTVKQGDFALPIRLADMDKKMVTAVNTTDPSSEYYVNFVWDSRYNPLNQVWTIDNSVEGGAAATATAIFQYGTPYVVSPAPDGTRVKDYDLSICNFRAQTVDFDANDETTAYWRTVHQGSQQTGGEVPSLHVAGSPTTAVKLYVWSMDESAVRLVTGKDAKVTTRSIHMTATATEPRQVAEISIVAGKQDYEFLLEGVTKDLETTLVLSAFPDFNYQSGFVIKERLADYETRKVFCSEPLPASVIVKPKDAKVKATSESYQQSVTELNVSFSEPFGEDVALSVEPSLTAAGDAPWTDYIRFSAKADDDVTLQTGAFTNLVIKAGETKPQSISDGVQTVALTDGKIYVYTLRGDKWSDGTSGKIQFKVTTKNAQALKPSTEGGIDGWNANQSTLTVTAQAPVIAQPAEGDVFEAIQFDPTPLTIRVEGAYADVQSTSDYEIYVKLTPAAAKFTKLDGLYRPGDGNVLYKSGTTDELPTLTYASTSTAENPWKTRIYVVAKVSGKSSAPDADYRTINAVVSPARSSSVTAFNAKTGVETQEFAEGDRVKFKIEISDSYDSDLYAFLAPSENITTGAIFSGTTAFITNMTNATGLRIGRGKTSAEGIITMLDGWNPDDGGLNFSVEVILRDKQKWNAAGAKTIKGFDCQALDLTVNNVEPAITRLELNGIESESSGYRYPNKLAAGQPQEFKAVVKDTTYDLDHEFKCKWTPYLNGVAQETTTTTITGNPTTHTYTNKFEAAGIWTVRLQVQDKDMADWAATDYKVEVEVLTNPSVTIEAEEVYMESDTKATVNVGLTYLDPGVTLYGSITGEVYKTGVKNPGKFVFETNDIVFTSSALQTLRVTEMDGTGASSSYGFRLTAKIEGAIDAAGNRDPDAVNSKTGKKWREYFLPAEARVFVENVAPNGGDESKTFSPDSNTNVWEVAGGAATAHPLRFFVRSDVDEDFSYMMEKWGPSGTETNGIKVTIMGGSGESYNEDGFVNGVKYFNEPGDGTFVPNFGSSQGDQSVTITVEDKDGGTLSRTWKFTVTPSKFLTTIATGPSGGTTSSSLSQKYAGAAGLGQGHVWANELFVSASDFRLDWNCSKDQTASLYAWGYKVGETDNGSLNGNRDIALSATGSAQAGVTPSPFFEYKDTVKDSFLYTWLQTTTDESGTTASAILGAIAPERYQPGGLSPVGVADVVLASEQNDDKTYPKTIVEAVFAKEYLPTDNMGDINQDGIPDLYVTKYYMGVVDETTGALAENGKDLKSLKSYNADLDKDGGEAPDYLPGYSFSEFGTLIPELPSVWKDFAVEFSAYMEIRGYGDGLNDAPALAGITGVKPDRIYAEKVGDTWQWTKNCTLSELEYVAWCAYAAANGLDFAKTNDWSKWSPERPTSPVLDDTDEDGFSDGYEYYFWYRATVGDPDAFAATKSLKRLTGRRYDPRNPGEGRLITSEEIAATFDPLTPNGSSETAKLVDTDNDGLPDYLEFLIGTNPVDFDTDGDGLPDGFEILLCGTDPLTAMTVDGISDAMRNYDGDAMAFTTPALEANVVPTPFKIDVPYSFALVDAKGYTDGVQWYVSDAEPTGLTTNEAVAGTSLVVDGVTYVTTNAVALVGGRLALDLPKATTWTVTNIVDGVFTAAVDEVVALMPTRLPAGTVVASTNAVTAYSVILTNAVADANAAWVYGRSVTSVTTGDSLANMGGFGMLAVGHYKPAPANVRLAALPKADTSVATLHYLVYQKYGFDPRTAWNANTPLATRWGKTVSTGEGESASTETVANNFDANWGYAGVATRTREFTLYDEFLVFSFFLNNNTLAEADVTPTTAQPWSKIWSKYTTNGQGPNEPAWTDQYADSEGTIAKLKGRTAETDSGTNGADTDEDGVPDGWELYVMAGPKDAKTGKFHFAAPYNDGFYSSFGPFVKDAAKASVTDNSATGGNDSAAGDGDGLTELQEFAGTDSCAYYSTPQGENESAYSTTIVRPDEHKTWFNKFFPTDPWNKDTDGDGLSDSQEKGFFAYGDVDTGKVAVPGGGLNPCTVDTDLDGLPDGWEKQFAGSTVYTGEDCQWAEGTDADGNAATSSKTSLQGLCDGMDGTVFDAFNSPRVNRSTTSGTETKQVDVTVTLHGIGLGVAQVVDRDYDHDGLENWQEYLTGVMRCWRYDDPLGTWGAVPDEAFFDADGNFILEEAMKQFGFDDENEFWYETLFNKGGKFYNPHFVSGTSPAAQYFSRVTNGWDMCFSDTGSYYVFYDRVNEAMYSDIWGYKAAPKKYISTSPIVADTDKDGMDDGYELFHGMNPLLGESGVLVESDGPCDVVFDAWYTKGVGAPVDALHNNWMDGRPGYGDYDFVAHPWLNGLVDADPDGDDIRSQDEAIMPMVAPSTTWYHTDPTPLWMTDSSYSNSLTRLFFRLPTSLGPVSLPSKEYIEWNGVKYYFRDCDGYVMTMAGPVLAPFLPDRWALAGEGTMNWMYSFEENEGYDTDHDAASDSEELSGKFRAATDPQDANSPRRRQAMYFQGPENPSALQSMPFASELYPRAATGYPDDLSLLQYTVECWVRPESTADATVIERAVYTSPSHCADEMLVRCNFRIAVKDGKWYTKFDSNGTLADKPVEVVGATSAAVGEWTYVAATYDAKRLVLYVNGEIDGQTTSSLKPAYGSSAVVVYPGESKTSVTNSSGGLAPLEGEAHMYWYDREYAIHAFLVGASFRTDTEPGVTKNHLNVLNAKGWDYYKDFFKGYVDEIRVWDGALSSDTIASTHYALRKRFSREDALANRSTVYSEWSKGQTRYNKDGDGNDLTVTPELRFHWGFDSVPGAENAAKVAVAPRGFINGAKAEYSRPDGYVIPWWNAVVDGYGSVYAGLRNWVTWIPNTVTHLPRFDATTLDSAYWSENYAGDTAGTYKFARTAEPVSLWTQFVRHGTDDNAEFQTTCRRFWLSNNTGTNASSTLSRQFEFTGRHLNQSGDDLLPLGGAFVKYVDRMWDDNKTASETWDYSGTDADGDGLPDWWQTYAEQNYREGLQPGTKITWDTVITYAHNGVKRQMKAGQAYLYDVARGAYVDLNGVVHAGPTAYAQNHMTDGLIPDWWKKLMKIDDEEPLADTDNDGLSNFAEYLASEAMSFGVTLDPTLAKSDTKTLDYFRAFGKLYLGEMLTDHDQMEDHWERSLSDENVASASLWDATKDADGDGWDNFAENRYNGHKQSTLAQLVSHAMGDAEVLDAPIPSIKLTVRYNGANLSTSAEGDQPTDGGESSAALPNLVVRTFSADSPAVKADATFTMQPGTTVSKEVYMGGWEDRVVRGTMAPGNVDITSVNLRFRQIVQSDLYSWTDESGTHISRPYSEFKAALEKDSTIVRNVQLSDPDDEKDGDEAWLKFEAATNPRGVAESVAVTIGRDALTQKGMIAVYGEEVGSIDLTTGDFEFDMAKLINLTGIIGTYDEDPADAWGLKEAIFKLTYRATIPALQANKMQISLATADTGFVRGGKNTIAAFFDNDGNGEYTPGEPFGVLTDVDIGWAGRELEMELTDMSAVTPRIDLWSGDSDRAALTAASNSYPSYAVVAGAPAAQCRVRVMRYALNGKAVRDTGVATNYTVFDQTFDKKARTVFSEGDLLKGGALDIDWDNLLKDSTANAATYRMIWGVTNATYVVVFDEDTPPKPSGNTTPVQALGTTVERRFEFVRRRPTPCPTSSVFNRAHPTFAWRIDGEDPWVAKFGTSYTAFKVRVKTSSGALLWESKITRLPPKDGNGIYRWTAPISVGSVMPNGALFENFANYTWEMALYNAKFRTDDVMSVDYYGIHDKDSSNKGAFSDPLSFRMNVTTSDASSEKLAVRVCYSGPAKNLAGKVRVQAFKTPDFTGDPLAEVTIGGEDLSPAGVTTNAALIGLSSGAYYLRAYIDTDGDLEHDDWESWGYLSERDRADKAGIFNPVSLATAASPAATGVRKVYIEDCDTDGDWFPDVWEAEQNGNVFDSTKIAPVKGTAELIGVNTNLDATLNKTLANSSVTAPLLMSLRSPAGVAMMSGVSPSQVSQNAAGVIEVESEIDEETLAIVGFDLDVAARKVALKIGAEVNGALDTPVADFLAVTVRKGSDVKVVVKHAETIGGDWTTVATGFVKVTDGAGDIDVTFDEELPSSGFFKVEIVQ